MGEMSYSKIEDVKRLRVKKKPTRRQLLMIISQLQQHIGKASAYHTNDRDGNAHENCSNHLSVAHQICIDAASFDNPIRTIKDIL